MHHINTNIKVGSTTYFSKSAPKNLKLNSFPPQIGW